MKQTLLVLMGGVSGEHEVSLRSGSSVLTHLNPERFEALPVAIGKDGRWLTGEPLVLDAKDPAKTRLAENLREVRLDQGCIEGRKIDCVFSVIHGTWGEDGCMQGLLEMARLPYIGAGVAGSAIGIDKDLTKRLTLQAGIKTADFVALKKGQPTPSWAEVTAQLGQPVFIKPASQGSSLGISKAKDEAGYQAGLAEAFLFDTKVVVEAAITGRELELAVLGNGPDLLVSPPGEILPEEEFYTYEAKYLLNTTRLEVPAKLEPALVERLQSAAKQAFLALELKGFARMDFFVDTEGEIWFNEPNTLPGFTSISLYPKLIGLLGIDYAELLERLVDLALEDHALRQGLEQAP